MTSTIKCLLPKIDKYLITKLGSSMSDSSISHRREKSKISFWQGDSDAERTAQAPGQGTTALAENCSLNNSVHSIPTVCYQQFGRQLQESILHRGIPQSMMYSTYPVQNHQESILYSGIPQSMMYSTYPVQNHICNTYFNHWQHHLTNFQPSQSNNQHGPEQMNSHGRYFHRNVDHSSRNELMRRGYDEEIMSVRLWQKVTKPSSTPGFIFTVMSYNVLAQDLLEQHPFLYHGHNKQFLNWQTRWKNILEEIKKLMPDILCLQEVQESHIQKYYSFLETLGYEGLFKKRTGNQCDGCAIYYKIDNVTLKDYSFVEYYQPIVTVLNRDNIGIVAKFAPKIYPTQEFVIATTHLLYNPKRNDVRMAQMQLLLTEIEKLSYQMNQKKSLYIPVILTGDLNSSPESDLYDFITKGVVKYEQLSPRLLVKDPKGLNEKILVTSSLGITDKCQHSALLEKRCNMSNIPDENSSVHADGIQDENEKNHSLRGTGVLSHDFGFSSVYSHDVIEINDHNERRIREGTTFQDEWLTVDYIFYSANQANKRDMNKIKLLSRYRLPTTDELGNIKIPNRRLGSDHLSLAAKFKLEFRPIHNHSTISRDKKTSV